MPCAAKNAFIYFFVAFSFLPPLHTCVYFDMKVDVCESGAAACRSFLAV